MSDTERNEVFRWVERVKSSLAEQGRVEAADYQRLEPTARWSRVAAVCHRVNERLDDEQRERIEKQAEADARRFGELMRAIEARANG